MADFIKYIVSELKSKRLPKDSARALLEQFSRGAGAGRAGVLHPLLHANTSDLSEQSYASWFDGQEFFLSHHVARLDADAGRKVLPAVAYLEMAREAIRLALPPAAPGLALELKQTVWAQPIVVDRRSKISIALHANDSGDIEFEVFSEVDGQERVHCQGSGAYFAAASLDRLPLAALEQQMQGHWLSGETLYAQLWQMGLEYGSSHQAVEGMARGDGQALARLCLPAELEADAPSYVLHPSLMDGALQACIGLMAPAEDTAAQLLLPYAVESVRIARSCTQRMLAWVRQAPGSTDALRKLDIDLCDEQGQVCVQMRAFSARAVNASVAAPVMVWATPQWQAAPLAVRAGAREAQQRHVLLSGLEHVQAPVLERNMQAPGQATRCLHLAPGQARSADAAHRYTAEALACHEQVQALLRAMPPGGAHLQLVMADDAEASLSAGLAGLLRTASQENPQLRAQVVLVDPAMESGELARTLQAEQGPQTLVRYRAGQREVQGWQERPWQGEQWPVAFRDDGVYLITGGLGELGRLFAGEILRRTARGQVFLTGRAPLDAARKEHLHGLSGGARVHYRQVSLEDLAQVRALVDAVVMSHGRLDGIIHSAGQIADNFIFKKSAAEFDAVLAPKVIGTRNLDLASQTLALDFMVMFSSLASAMGNVGQADYASANGFMDQYAWYRNALVEQGARKGRTVAINWPLWAQGGMQMEQASAAWLHSTGLQALSSEMGLQAFYGALNEDGGQVMALQGERQRLQRVLTQGAFSAQPATAGVVPAEQRAPAAGDTMLEESTQGYLRRQLSDVLQLPSSRIDVHAALETYGIDSIVTMNLTRVLEKTFGPLSKTLLFEYQTLAALAQYFVLAHGAKLSELFARPAPAESLASPAVQANAVPPASRRKSRRNVNAQVPAPAPNRPDEAIAVIGLSGRYPQARDLDAFWHNLREGIDCVTEVPAVRWDWRAHYSTDRTEPGRHYSKWGGFIEGVDEFDPLFFNISPREARNIDPQERLFLQHAWMAMEDAGYTRAALQVAQAGDLSGQVGVYAGVMYSEYQLFGAEAGVAGRHIPIANSFASIANRVSYALNLHGPSMTLDTMCSSSLTAIHLACQDLKLGRTDMAIAGGVNISIHPQKYLMLSAGQFISSDGHCQSFGEGGDGYIPGEGVGIVVLKRLSEAQRDGDQIHGLILGSGLNHGGKTNGYSVPNPHAQSQAIARTLAAANVDARHISYVEAHGTGTKLGDPIEIAALSRAFGHYTQEHGFCRIGSAKSNIGHCESAAGIAGLMKVLLQMRHGEIVASLHSSKLNPHIDFSRTPFVVNQQRVAWERPRIDGREIDRIAGLSSFGAGGSNAHMIVQEYRGGGQPAYSATGPAVIVLSARTAEQLQHKAQDLLAYLARQGDSADLAGVAYTLQVGREAMDERLGLLAGSAGQLMQKLQAFVLGEQDGEDAYRGHARRSREGMGLISQDEDMQEAVDKWIARKKLGKLLELWVKGLEVDWSKLYAGNKPTRISLPLYPFARERHWLDAEPAAEGQASKLHPLLHANTSDLSEQRYTSWFDGRESFLSHHQVRLGGDASRKVLPAVAYLEMARAAIRLAMPDAAPAGTLELKQVVWAQPVVVDSRSEVNISLQAGADGEIEFEVYSTADDGQERLHCQGRAALAVAQPRAPLDLAALESQMQGDTLPGMTLYERLRDMGLLYGPSHQAVESLTRGEDQLLARLRLPPEVTGQAASFVLHPSLMDGALQACMGLMTEAEGAAARLLLPYAVESVRVLGNCSARMLAWVRPACGSASAFSKLDIDLCDELGQVCVELRAFSVRAADGAVLAPAPGLLWTTPQWQAAAIEAAGQPAQQCHVWLIGLAQVQTGALGSAMQAAGQVTRCQRLAQDDPAADPARRYMRGAEACFEQVQALLGTKLHGQVKIQLVVADAAEASLSAGLSGLLRTASQENPQLSTQLVLVDPLIDTADLARTLQGEQGLQAVVRYRAGQRLVLGWQEQPWQGAGWPVAFKDDGVYLISGGLGGLGRLFAQEIMAHTRTAQVILTGRGALDAARQAQLSGISTSGRVQYRQVDLEDRVQVEAMFDAIGRLDGIIHCAGQTSDNFIVKKISQELRAVLAPKVIGTMNLDLASRALDLDFMVLFSSVAAAMGNIGQADYACANGFMDQYALYRNELVAQGQRHGRTVAINWPLWEQGGMQIEPASQSWLHSLGIDALQTAVGVQAFHGALALGHAQVLVMQGDRPRLASMLLQGTVAAVRDDTRPAPLANPAPAQDGMLEEQTWQYLRQQLAAVLQVPAERIDVHAPLDIYGIDSVLSMSLTRELEKTFGPLSKTLLFEYQTLGALARYFMKDHAQVVGDKIGGGPASPLAAAAKQPVLPMPDSTHRRKRRFAAAGVTDGENATDTQRVAIAIIGVSGRYPHAADLDAYWENLKHGRDCIGEIPPERWDLADYFDSNPAQAGKSYGKWGGFIADVDRFDPLFFGISPKEAERIDPQERLFLETAWKAVEDAGYSKQSLAGSRVGVFVGVMWGQYELLGLEALLKGGTTVASASHASIANRVSYMFDWHGPSIALDTMCSSSLTAIHLACESIRSGDSEAAIAGGVNLSLHPKKYLGLSQGKFLATDGRCRSFGDGGDGYVPGEGVGALVLKPLEQALRDGDHVYAVVRASGVNHGGKTNGYSVPNPTAQGNLIREVLKRGAVDPASVSYIEAHGTGTALGDPIEIKGLLAAFSADAQGRQPCAIGSVKSNIGHLEAAAGIAAVTKVLLQIKHGQLVPSLHAEPANQYIDFAATPFQVQTALADWTPRNGGARRACVSSFGAGGSNAHLVLDEYVAAPVAVRQSAALPEVVLLSGRDTDALRRYAHDMACFLERGALPALADLAYTTQVGRMAQHVRLAITAVDHAQLAQHLRQWLAQQDTGAGATAHSLDGVFQGDARSLRDNTGDLFSGSSDAFANDLLDKRDLPRLARLWALGVDLNWQRLPRVAAPLRVSLPTYPFSRERYWIESNDAPIAPIAPPPPAAAIEAATSVFYTPQWRTEAVPAHVSPGHRKQVMLLLGAPDTLAGALQENGIQETLIIRVSWGDSYEGDGSNSFQLDPARADHFTRLLAALGAQQSLPDMIVHHCPDTLDLSDSPENIAAVHGILPLFHLCKALLAQQLRRPVRLLSMYASHATNPAPHSAAIAGFLRSLVLENPVFAAIALDVHGAAPAAPEQAGAILAELRGARPGMTAVRLSCINATLSRQILELVPYAPLPAAAAVMPVKQRGVYLITGGLGGLGVVFAEYLARSCQPTLILVGRSEPGTAQRRTIERLKQLGAQVRYVRADVTRRESMAALMRTVKRDHSVIHGVIHAAGVTRDAFLLKKTEQELAQVLAPKVDGTIHLDWATRDEPLDWFVLFSSVAAITGNPGQADYAYANHFMDAFAQARDDWRRVGRRCGQSLSINWPLWVEGGMAIAPADMARIEQKTGIRALPTADGLHCWEQLLASGRTQAVALYGKAADIDAFIRPAWQQPAAAASVPAPGLLPDDLTGAAQRYLQTLIGEEMNLPAQRVDMRERFSAYGFDSVMVARVNTRLEQDLGPLSKTLLFEYETVEELARHLVAHLHPALARLLAGPSAEATMAPAAMQAAVQPLPPPVQAQAAAAHEPGEAIAIIGMHGEYPGAKDLDAYWEHLKHGNDLIELVPASRWDHAALYSADPAEAAHGRIYCKWGGFLDDVDQFDPAFFNIPTDEARLVDPQERLFLRSVWSAIEDAGYTREALRQRHPRGKGAAVGVYVGVTTNTYNLLKTAGTGDDAGVSASALPWSIANRVSYFFDFEGPSMPVDTACSSSLVAIHLACESLRSGGCEVAVAGGVNLYLHPAKYQSLCSRRMVSSDGRCRSYGAGGDGFVPGEGVGTLILKPLRLAIADQDRIHGVIRASATAHSGRSNGYSAPNPNAQASLIEHALKQADIHPESISYIEGHGTGTPLGDSIEIAALTKAFRQQSAGTHFCPIGSVKANIGHAESAAGIAGITKVLLQMKHRQLVPTIHAAQANPNIEFETTPFYLQRHLAQWPSRDGQPRRSLVNSFGAGGVNACVILEEHIAPVAAARRGAQEAVLVLSARSEQALSQYAEVLLSYLRRHPALDLGSVCFTLQHGREAMEQRLAVVATGRDELIARLAAWRSEGSAGVYRGVVETHQAKADVGSQYPSALDAAHGAAQAWVGGGEVDWSALYGASLPARISLPAYPFENQRYWVSDLAPVHTAAAAAPVNRVAATGMHRLHPLVSHNASTLNHVSFSSHLPDTAFYAVDHQVNGEYILPGSACLEIALACGALAAEQHVAALRDIVWIRPLSFREGPQTLRTVLKRVDDSVEYAITSLGEDHERIVHAEGQLLLASRAAHAAMQDEPVPLRALLAQSVQRYDGVQFYEQMRCHGLAYGPAFQLIEEVHSGQDFTVSRLVLPDSLKSEFSEYTLHPALIDAAFQSVATLLNAAGGPFLPFALGEVDIVRPLTQLCYALAEFAETGQPGRTDARKLHVRLLNERGELLVRLGNLYVRQLSDAPFTAIMKSPDTLIA
ncbi:SDR family NAD(P)-dependent oxidoreductase [Janthinobacterium sp. FT14W]|uniref:SDR family NAD(P)-dependent oxidoreductase n=1 Tax=Janthinobacterium sp. FT14W TaxID=2654253 RepID=UPI001264534F|nr:SDR family NAD(P)-dependent oxidoreductase [Janthinobacterium sp. FT14W]KAB8061475.1 SDR family NAD(P)-dependent oxidoreductase [Janthinobacterium sp. FT14W]